MKEMFIAVSLIFLVVVIAYLRVFHYAAAVLYLVIWLLLSIIYRRELKE
ncbi:hypothetical protein [Enterococcus sp. BWR-S5]|nr:hypothetical protein [Enterococcus sp. BWR-S5]MBL1224815.1 hypothetical protein [Enterococcus sp. BWR-S5]